MRLTKERLKKMFFFGLGVGFFGGLILNFGGMAIGKVRNWWHPLFEKTGLAEKFGTDPTDSVEGIVALLMTVAALTLLAYIGTAPSVERLLRAGLKKIPFVKNFISENMREIDHDAIAEEVRMTKEDLRALEPILIPHFGHPQELFAAGENESRGTKLFLVAGYELAFVQGIQRVKFPTNGSHTMKVWLRVFKPSWPVMVQGTPLFINPEAGVLRIEATDFEQVEHWFSFGGLAEIDCLDIRPWKNEEGAANATPNESPEK